MELEGTATVEQLIARYAHAIDDRRFDDAGRLFATDARLVVGRHTFDGRDAIVATMLAAAASSEVSVSLACSVVMAVAMAAMAVAVGQWHSI